MLNKNAVIILKCIMDRDKCDLESAIRFIKHNQTCYEIARTVANAKDEDVKAEKEALINKACEWMGEFLRNHYIMRYEDYCEPCKDRIVEEFKQAMKGGE